MNFSIIINFYSYSWYNIPLFQMYLNLNFLKYLILVLCLNVHLVFYHSSINGKSYQCFPWYITFLSGIVDPKAGLSDDVPGMHSTKTIASVAKSKVPKSNTGCQGTFRECYLTVEALSARRSLRRLTDSGIGDKNYFISRNHITRSATRLSESSVF